MLNQPGDGRVNFAEEDNEVYNAGLTLRVGRGVYKQVERLSPNQLESLIEIMKLEIEGLFSFVKDGTLSPNDVDFYVKPIEGRIKLVQGLIDEQRKIAAIDLVGRLANPNE